MDQVKLEKSGRELKVWIKFGFFTFFVTSLPVNNDLYRRTALYLQKLAKTSQISFFL